MVHLTACKGGVGTASPGVAIYGLDNSGKLWEKPRHYASDLRHKHRHTALVIAFRAVPSYWHCCLLDELGSGMLLISSMAVIMMSGGTCWPDGDVCRLPPGSAVSDTASNRRPLSSSRIAGR